MLRLAFATRAHRLRRGHLFRLVPAFIALAIVATLTAAPARAQTPDKIAEQLNEEGKALMVERKPAEASKRFKDAAERWPDPRYFYNLCKAYYFQGMFYEAMDACGAARKNKPDDALTAKITDLEGLNKEAASKRGIDLSKPIPPTTPPGPENPQDPNNPNNPTQPDPTQPTSGPPIVTPNPRAPEGVYAVIAPRHEYVWTAGADLLIGGASFDTEGKYGDTFLGGRLRVDYMLSPRLQLGGQGYIDFMNVGSGSDTDLVDELTIFNFGLAAYKHVCFGALCATPLAGVQIGAVDGASLGTNEFDTAAFGFRLEGGISYAFGAGYEHVIGASLGVLGYAKPADTETLMFDRGGRLTYVALGYTRRFNTPFGSAPILGLE